MKKLLFVALAAGVITASCSGHPGANAIPATGMQPQTEQSSLGAQTTRAASLRPAAIPDGWAPTATHALNLTHATGVGTVPATKTMTVHVGLQMRDPDRAKAAIAAGEIIDPATFTSTYGPTSEHVSQVATYLREQGFRNIAVEPNKLIVSGTGTAAQVEKAFDTKLASFNQDGVARYGNTTPAFVPQALGGVAIAVLGLNNAQSVKTGPAKVQAIPNATPTEQPCIASEGGLCPRFYDPASFQEAYDAVHSATGSKTNVAIMTEGDLTQAIAYFRLNEQKFALAQAPINIVHVGTPSTDTSGATEWTLDMTYSTGLAGGVRGLYLYNFPSLSDGDIVMGYSKWATDDKAPIGNSSFGGCEVFPYEDGTMLLADEVLVEAALQGQTMFVSTGDNGGYCNNFVDSNGAPGGAPFAEWPAVSPYVNAVGGTDLFTEVSGAYRGETGWEAGGGGLSQFEYSPAWEQGVQPVGTTPAGYSFRGVPDVAMDASLETGALLWGGQATNGSCTPCTTGGTSLASPLAAGAYARMQSWHLNRLGFAPVRFYRIYNLNQGDGKRAYGPPTTETIGGFNDILSGSNAMYSAAPRYDYVTGLGSLRVLQINLIIGR